MIKNMINEKELKKDLNNLKKNLDKFFDMEKKIWDKTMVFT